MKERLYKWLHDEEIATAKKIMSLEKGIHKKPTVAAQHSSVAFLRHGARLSALQMISSRKTQYTDMHSIRADVDEVLRFFKGGSTCRVEQAYLDVQHSTYLDVLQRVNECIQLEVATNASQNSN